MLGLVILLSLVVTSCLPIRWIEPVLRYGGYWIILAVFVLFAIQLGLLFRNRKNGKTATDGIFFLGCMGLGIWLMAIHAEFHFKIAFDDYILVATSNSLHLNREFFVPTMGYWQDGDFLFNGGYLDKRPWFYAFLVSLVHDLSGMRVANAYWVNGVLAIVLLGLVYQLGKDVSNRFGGFISVLFLVSIPLVAQNATGAGMDMTNLCMLALTIYLGGRYLSEPGRITEGAFVASALLLVYSRYESLLYVAPAALVVLIGWVKSGRAWLAWPTLLSAALLTGYGLQYRFFKASTDLWELPGGVETPFGLHHLAENLPRAIYFFFNFDDTLANSTLVSLVGGICLLLFVLHCRREISGTWRERSIELSVAVFGLFICLNFLILLAYHDGKLDRLFASRLSLPFYLLLVLVSGAVLGRVAQARWARASLLALTALYILGWTLPMNSKAIFTLRNFVRHEIDWLTQGIGQTVGSNDLVIDHNSTPWTIERIASLRPKPVLQNLDWLQFRMEHGVFANVYLVERLNYRMRDGEVYLQKSSYPEGVLETELIAERSFRPFSLTRFYRVIDLHPERLPPDFLENLPEGNVQDYTYTGL